MAKTYRSPVRSGRTSMVGRTQGRAKQKTWRKRGLTKSVKVSPNLKQAIKQELLKDAENKKVMYSSGNFTSNQSLKDTSDVLQLLPFVLNGTGEDQKIGNTITIKSLTLRGVMTFFLPQQTAANCRIGVKLWIVRTKRYDDWLSARTSFASDYTNLLEGSNLGFTGTLTNFNTPINTDYFSVVYSKTYYMSQSLQATTTLSAQNNFTTKFINVKVPYCTGRKLHYDQNFDNDQPTDFPYYMLVSYVKLDGSAADLDGTQYLTFNYTTKLNYMDA